MYEIRSFDRRLLPPSVYLGSTDVIHVIKWTRPSSSVLCTASDQKLDDGKAWEGGYQRKYARS